MSKYKYQKEFLFSSKRLEDIELFLDNEETPLDLMLIRDGKKNTAIHHCAFLNQHRHIEFYLRYYRKNLENEGYTLTDIRNKTKMLLDVKNMEGYTAAHYAAFKGNITVLKCLQKYEANFTLPSDLGMSLLHFAAQGDKINTVLHVHDKGFDINGKDSKGSTPLHWACYSGSEKVVEYLLVQPGIQLNQQDQDGHTPLHIATAYGYSKIVRKLLVAGADRLMTNLKEQTALDIAKTNEFDKITKMLDDKYSLLDYLKFMCNAKVRYEPKNRSYVQSLLFYLLASLFGFMSFGVITIESTVAFWAQTTVFFASVALFTSLIVPLKQLQRAHSYSYYAQQEGINRLCMQCVRPMQFREYHCTTCKRCIPQYDHHCFWINNCVGKHNIIRFNLFLIVTEITLCWTAYLAIRTFIILQEADSTSSFFTLSPWVLQMHLELLVQIICGLISAVFIFLAFPMFCLIFVQQKNLLLGKTTYQRFSKSNESVLTRDGSQLLNRSWESSSPPSFKNCVSMCYETNIDDKCSESNSTTSSFVREH